MPNKFSFKVADKYLCNCTVWPDDTTIKVRSRSMLMSFNLVKRFDKDRIKLDIGYFVDENMRRNLVYIEEVQGLVQIGCLIISQSEFQSLINKVKTKTNECNKKQYS